MLLWGWAKDTPTTLQSNTWLWADHVKQNSVWALPTSNWKAFSSRKALKSIQKHPEPYSLVWQHQEKKFQREDLLLDKYRKGTGPEFLNNSETLSFLFRCFLLCTILKQRVFSSTSRNYCSWLKELPAWWKYLQWHKDAVGCNFWRLLTSDISVLFISHC